MLSYLVRCDYDIQVDCFAISCVCPFVLYVPGRVGTNPFQPGTHLHLLPLKVKEPLTQVHLHSQGTRTSLLEDKLNHSLVLTSKR